MQAWLRLTLCTGVSVLPGTVLGQASQPRSRDYLFVSAVDDARAAWVNPAGLGWVSEVSVMAELGVDRSGDALRLGQYTLGLNSRGLAMGYERDRSDTSASLGVARAAFGVPFGFGAIGASLSTYGSWHNMGFDLGLRYPLLAGLDGAIVVRDLGHPMTHGSRQPVVGIAGATWIVAPGTAAVSAEAIATERLVAAGYDLMYRAGIELRAARTSPVALHAAASVGTDGTLRRWALGLMLGRMDRVGLIGGTAPTAGLGTPDEVTVVGVASNRAHR